MTVHLPDVTLVAIDCVAHELTKLALADTLRQVSPAEVIFWSDKDLCPSGQFFEAELNSMKAVETVLWHEVPRRVKTSHWLLIQYDGWALDSHRWDSVWLNCDYVGAPWWYKQLNVGNGGFSLRSTAMTKFVANNPSLFPLKSPEDQTLCRDYRHHITRHGFLWASEYEAQRFAFERAWEPNTFGFHGMFNWHKVLDPDEFQLRISLANEYVRSKVEWKELNLV